MQYWLHGLDLHNADGAAISIPCTQFPIYVKYCLDNQWSVYYENFVGNYVENDSTFNQLTPGLVLLTHWGRVMHICVSKLIITGSDNGLLPGQRQAIIQTNAGILLIEPLRTNFSEISIEIHTFSFKEMHLKMSSGRWRPFCLGLNVLTKITETSIKISTSPKKITAI